MKKDLIEILISMNQDICPPFPPKDLELIHKMVNKVTRNFRADMLQHLSSKSFISNGEEVVRLQDIKDELQS